ncbi:hypothetical protein [Caudoviricetes sp.]|nr:hypothetical protein [Caudoviricetes sp.]
MANVIAPRGLSPVGTVVGADWNQQGRLYAIASDATNTYAIGDIVMSATSSDANGVPYAVKFTEGSVPLGVIVGIQVASPGVSLQGTTLSLEQSYIGLNAGTRYVYVVDDPNVIFQVQFDSTGVTQANIHKNAALTITANQTSLSQSSPYSSTVATAAATTNTLPLRLLGLAQQPNNTFGANATVLAKFNIHEFGAGTGTNFTGV